MLEGVSEMDVSGEVDTIDGRVWMLLTTQNITDEQDTDARLK